MTQHTALNGAVERCGLRESGSKVLAFVTWWGSGLRHSQGLTSQGNAPKKNALANFLFLRSWSSGGDPAFNLRITHHHTEPGQKAVPIEPDQPLFPPTAFLEHFFPLSPGLYTNRTIMAPAAFPSTPQASTLTVPADSSVWDRISTWASENKAIVYTLAGAAVVVTGAGAVYYIRSSSGQVRHRTATGSRWAHRRIPAKGDGGRHADLPLTTGTERCAQTQ